MLVVVVVVVVAVITAAVSRYYYDCCATIVNFTIVFVSFLPFFMNKSLDYYLIPDDSDNFSLLCRLVDEPDGCSSSLTSSHESFLGITTIAVHIQYKFKTHPTPHNYGHQYLIVQRFFYNCCGIFGCLSCELTSYYFRR